jgi:hypothetical protein
VQSGEFVISVFRGSHRCVDAYGGVGEFSAARPLIADLNIRVLDSFRLNLRIWSRQIDKFRRRQGRANQHSRYTVCNGGH